MLAPTDKKPGAIYTARWRRRQKAGRILVKAEVDEAEITVALVAHGLLDPLKADDPAALNAAVAKLLQQFCAGETSLHEQRIDANVRVGLLLRALKRTSRRGFRSR